MFNAKGWKWGLKSIETILNTHFQQSCHIMLRINPFNWSTNSINYVNQLGQAFYKHILTSPYLFIMYIVNQITKAQVIKSPCIILYPPEKQAGTNREHDLTFHISPYRRGSVLLTIALASTFLYQSCIKHESIDWRSWLGYNINPSFNDT